MVYEKTRRSLGGQNSVGYPPCAERLLAVDDSAIYRLFRAKVGDYDPGETVDYPGQAVDYAIVYLYFLVDRARVGGCLG